MALTQLIAVGLAEVLDLPLIEALCAPEAIKPLKDHFTRSADALGKSMQGCYTRALYGIALGIAPSAIDPKQALAARVTKDLGRRVEQHYLLHYAEQRQLDEQALKDLRRRAVRLCRAGADAAKTVLPRGDIPEIDLAELFQDARQGALGALVIERMQATPALAPHLDQDILDLLAYQDLLGQAVLYFLREDLRQDKRVQATLQALQQAGVWADVQALQAAQTSLAAGLESQHAQLSEQLAAHQAQIIALVQAGRYTDMAPLQAQAATLQGQLEAMNERTAALPKLLAELERRLAQREADFAGLRVLATRGIDEIQTGLAAMEQRLAEVLIGIDDGVRRVERNLLDLTELVQTLKGEGGDEQLGTVVRELIVCVERLQARTGPVRAEDSYSIQDELERRAVKALLARIRALPPGQRAAIPALLNGAGKLEQALGDYAAAQDDFDAAARAAAGDARAQAEARYNAYRMALEGRAWDSALDHLKAAATADPARFTPFRLDEFEPLRILGAGGFGAAFLCRDPLGQERVIKTLYEQANHAVHEPGQDALYEARILARLHHPHIVRVVHAGYAWEGRVRPYMVMEYLAASSGLDDHVAAVGPLSVATVRKLAIALASALEAAHDKGILHRDIKPGNVLIRQDENAMVVKLIDFGLALCRRIDERSAMLTQHKTLLGSSQAGTLAFAAPEQLAPGVPVGPPADIYGLGATLSWCLFQQTRPDRAQWRELDRQDEALADVLDRCLKEQPGDRFASARALLDALQVDAERERQEQAERERQAQAGRERAMTQTQSQSQGVRVEATPSTPQALQEQAAKALGREVVLRDPAFTVTVNDRVLIKKGGLFGRDQFEERRRELKVVPPEMVIIPPGRFLMGSPGDEPGHRDDEVQHGVTISKPFALGRYAVTFDEYDAYCEATGCDKPNDKGWGRGNRPVINVSWEDAIAYCEWLSKQASAGEQTKVCYRLPTEAEWEYACRAGTTTPFWWGDQISTERANYGGNYTYDKGKKGTYREQTVPVDQFEPNPWGLYQMHGNVWEWVHDWYGDYGEKEQTDPLSDSGGSDRVIRGGSWSSVPAGLRSACRYRYAPDYRSYVLGLRLARTLL